MPARSKREQPINPDAPTLYTIEQAQKVLNVSRGAVRNLVAAGKLKHIRVGRSIRITERSVYKFINDQLQQI